MSHNPAGSGVSLGCWMGPLFGPRIGDTVTVPSGLRVKIAELMGGSAAAGGSAVPPEQLVQVADQNGRSPEPSPAIAKDCLATFGPDHSGASLVVSPLNVPSVTCSKAVTTPA